MVDGKDETNHAVEFRLQIGLLLEQLRLPLVRRGFDSREEKKVVEQEREQLFSSGHLKEREVLAKPNHRHALLDLEDQAV